MSRIIGYLLLCLISSLFFLISSKPASAVPPLVTGDVPTADKGTMEVFLGTRYRKTEKIERQLPFEEIVLGISNWQELTFEIPYLVNTSPQGRFQGFGDAVLGTKIQFLEEDETNPGMALSFEAKLDNGNQRKGLGSGATDFDLRWRMQKTRAWFTGIGNVGYTFTGEPRVEGIREKKRDVWLLAFAQEYRISTPIKLLSEIYWKTNDAADGPDTFAGNIGFKYTPFPGLQIHTAVGKSLRVNNRGGPDLLIYGGLKMEFSMK